jgi:hypothetical protein
VLIYEALPLYRRTSHPGLVAPPSTAAHVFHGGRWSFPANDVFHAELVFYGGIHGVRQMGFDERTTMARVPFHGSPPGCKAVGVFSRTRAKHRFPAATRNDRIESASGGQQWGFGCREMSQLNTLRHLWMVRQKLTVQSRQHVTNHEELSPVWLKPKLNNQTQLTTKDTKNTKGIRAWPHPRNRLNPNEHKGIDNRV